MLGISFFELLVIIFIMLVLVKPSDIPSTINVYRKFIKKFVGVKREFTENFCQIHNELIDVSTNEDTNDDYQYVLDDEGKLQRSYDITHLKEKI